MSLLPSFRGKFEDTASDEKIRDGVQKIKNTKGVVSVAFNDQSRSVDVTYFTGHNVIEEVQKIDGLKLDL